MIKLFKVLMSLDSHITSIHSIIKSRNISYFFQGKRTLKESLINKIKILNIIQGYNECLYKSFEIFVC